MIARICWNCHFFEADNPGSLTTGICRRNAPKGRDFTSLGIGNQLSHRIELGHINEDGAVKGDEVLPLHVTGYIGNPPAETPASCGTSNAVGINSDTVNPIALPEGVSTPVEIAVFASRMNTGTDTVGEQPMLHVQTVKVRGDDALDGWSVDVPIPPDLVGIQGATEDNFVAVNVPISQNGFSGLFGMRIDLTGAGEDDISEIRNLKIGVLFANRQGDVATNPSTSRDKWAIIGDGETQHCGEFKPSTETIPPIPAI